MRISTMSKGQVTVPKEVRTHLNLHDGDRLEFLIDAEGKVVLVPVAGSYRKAFGMLHQPGMRAVSVEEMNEGIARFHAEENERILKRKG